MCFLERGIYLEDALHAFDFGGQVAGALRFGKGHINDTFAVYTQQPDTCTRRFILQRINSHVFANPAHLMQNIVSVTQYLREEIEKKGGDPDREAMTVLQTKAGEYFYTDAAGKAWRCYLFIEDAACLQVVQSPELFRAMARCFGKFSRLLEGYPANTLHEIIDKFHDTRDRMRKFKKSLAEDKMGRAKECLPEIEFVLERQAECGVLMDKLDAGELPLRVTHNDTKMNNIMMDTVKVKGVCVIDLDTVMPGLMLNDFGDSIRSGANTATEDEKDLGVVSFSLPLYEIYAKEYLHALGDSITCLEKELLPWGAKLMTYECGMRFLTDFLDGDIYFKTDWREHNLIRCRTQFKLVRDMEKNWNEMQQAIT